MRLADPDRVREEDPFTDNLIADFPNRIVVHRSRFEVDLNRARDGAIYHSPEQCWGLDVWQRSLDEPLIAGSLAFHDQYYAELGRVLHDLELQHGKFVLVDVHSYNHRRDGPMATPASEEGAPEINIGTFSMDRERWAPVLTPFMEALRSVRIGHRNLDVRENVAFQGKGEQTRFVHANFPKTGCGIAVEFKKTFMDEWTGEPNWPMIGVLRSALASTVPILETALRDLR